MFFRISFASIAVLVVSSPLFAAVPTIAYLKPTMKAVRAQQLHETMKRVHDGKDSPLWTTRMELKKDAPNWELLTKNAKAFAEMAEVIRPALETMTYTSRSRYWYSMRYIDDTEALGKAIQMEDKQAATVALGHTMNSCGNCHLRQPRFAREEEGQILIRTKWKSLMIVSDREESIPQFFQRQQIAVAHVMPKELKLLAAGKGTPEKVFVDGTNTNDDPPQVLFGSNVKIAAPTATVAKLIAEFEEDYHSPLAIIFRLDPKDESLFHPVGVTRREPWSFFEPNAKRPLSDEFTPADLIHKTAKQKK